MNAKTLGEVKAEPFTTGKLDRWLKGLIPRRILAVPFGGPLPHPNAPRGMDIDGEWFSERTDLTDGHKALLATRERIADWHHDMDPTGRMKGAILGRVVMDAEPEDDGHWADFWANAGEARLKLVAALEASGAKLYGSSQAAYKKAEPSGEITVWPMIRHAISTSPQNTLAVVPSLKAVLTDPSLEEMPADAIRALLVGYDALEPSLRTASVTGSGAAKAGRVLSARNEGALKRALDELANVLAQLERDEAALAVET